MPARIECWKFGSLSQKNDRQQGAVRARAEKNVRRANRSIPGSRWPHTFGQRGTPLTLAPSQANDGRRFLIVKMREVSGRQHSINVIGGQLDLLLECLVRRRIVLVIAAVRVLKLKITQAQELTNHALLGGIVHFRANHQEAHVCACPDAMTLRGKQRLKNIDAEVVANVAIEPIERQIVIVFLEENRFQFLERE